MWSEELQVRLRTLTPKQRAAVPRLANAIVTGRGIAHLLRGKDRVCSEHTYYRKPRPGTHGAGWHHQPEFREALNLAVEELNGRIVNDYVDVAVKRMAEAMPEAAELWATQVRYGKQATVRLNRRGESDQDRGQIRADVELAKVGHNAASELADRVSEMTARKGQSEADLVAARLAAFMLADGGADGVGEAGGRGDGGQKVARVAETAGAV